MGCMRSCSESPGAELVDVDVEPCKGAPLSCELKRNTRPTITITFKPSMCLSEDPGTSFAEAAVTNVTSIVHGILGFFPIPFPLPNPRACKDSGLACPLVAGSTNSYNVSLPIRDEYPSVGLRACK